MSLSLKPKVAAVAISALAAILVATTACNGNNQPVNTQPPAVVTPQKPTPTPQTNIGTIVSGTPIPAVEEEKDELQWRGNAPYLSYKKGDISWKANIAEDITYALTTFKTPEDFFMKGAIVEEKYGHVIAWGNVQNKAIGKISFRSIRSGYEDSNYWLKSERVNDILVIYDVQTTNGLKDYLVIAGETHITDLLNKAGGETGLITNKLPVIEIRELSERGSKPLTFNLLTYVQGAAESVTAERDEKGNVTLNIAVRTRTNPDGGIASVKLTDILALEKEAPIFGGY